MRVRKQKSNVRGYAHVFPLEVKRDLCSRMKITKAGQDWLLHHQIDQCFGRSRYLSRYGFLRELRVKIGREVIRDVSENRISNSERERGWLRKPMHRSGKGLKVPCVGRALVYLVRAVTKWIMCS